MTVAATECPLCHGSGWKTADPSAKDPVVTRCDCKLSERAQRLLEQARIPARYKGRALDNFEAKYTGANPALYRAALAADRFVKEYPLDKTGLLFLGTIGVGKTHLAVGIVRALIVDKGVPCLFCDYRELLKEIQNSYNPSVSATEMSILRPVFEAEVLMLDELGAVKPTEWVSDTVNLILNTRYNDMRTTIITSNLKDEPAAAATREGYGRDAAARATREETLGDRIGERMRSRLHEMCRKITLEGEDFRLKMRNATVRDQ